MVGAVKGRKKAEVEENAGKDTAQEMKMPIVFIIPRQAVPQEYGTSVRQTEVEVLLKVLTGTMGGVYRRGEISFYARFPDCVGEGEWCSSHILRRYYLDQPKGDIAIGRLADRIIEDVKASGEADKIGFCVIEDLMRARIMQYDKFRED